MASLKFHAWYEGLKAKVNGEYKHNNTLATTYHMVRGTDFEGEPIIDTDEWECNSGSSTTKMGNDRTSASAEPTWEMKPIFGEFLEEGFYGLLGDVNAKSDRVVNLDSPVGKKAYNWVIQKSTDPLPLFTLKNSYFITNGKSIIYDNAKLSEYKFEFDDKGVTLTPTFSSDAPLLNQPLPSSKDVPTTLSKLGVNNFKVFIGDYGSEIYDIENAEISEDITPFDCTIKGSLNASNNLDDFACIGNTFGESNKDETEFTCEGELEIKYNVGSDGMGGSKSLIDKWYAESDDGYVHISQDNYFAEVLLIGKNRLLGTKDGEDIYEQLLIYLPKVDMTKAWSQLSGSDTKTIELEFETVSSSQTPMYVNIVSETEKLTNES